MAATITVLLQRVRDGQSAARDELFAIAYDNLKRLARARLRGGGRNTELDTTALVHEAYLRFVGSGELRAEDRRAFFAYASRVMRSVIVDSARERLAERRGGDMVHLTLTTQMADGMSADEESILRVHEALTVLEAADPRLAQVVEMLFRGIHRAGDRRRAGHHRSDGAARLGEGAIAARSGAEIAAVRFCVRKSSMAAGNSKGTDRWR